MNKEQRVAGERILLTLFFSYVLAYILDLMFGAHLIFYPVVCFLSMMFLTWVEAHDGHSKEEDDG